MPELKNLVYYQNLRYPIEILEDNDAYVASIPDLPGCVSYGETIPEAVESLREVKKLWLEGRLEAGLSIPEPSELDEYSGKFVLRITRALHKSLQRESQRQGVSLNQYIGQILAERHKLADLEHVVRDAVNTCLDSPEFSKRLLWSHSGIERGRCYPLARATVSISSEQSKESLLALLGEKHSKSYQMVYRSEAHSGFDWTINASKKAKAHSQHG